MANTRNEVDIRKLEKVDVVNELLVDLKSHLVFKTEGKNINNFSFLLEVFEF
jgi:hypothetical protein